MDRNEESIFAAAFAMADPTERAAFLDRACADDPALRESVESLLAAYQVGSYLEDPGIVLSSHQCLTVPYEPDSVSVGKSIDRYRLLEQIGEGGMGLVFVAEQQQPVHRRVALKLIKPGMDTRHVVARFEAERQALALMDHPNIARVLDAGASPEGRPYFVMELVKGVPITEYCDARRTSVRERLGLFHQVCSAVQHAHQKGIIHRDLKPSNVLVAVHDVIPVVKVIDFGIAKAVGQPLTDKTIYTELSQLVGTPLYMSPEQAGQSSLDIDTRTDVYSLGVLLYELLTGTTPIERETIRNVSHDELRRIIREDDPARLSARLSTLRAEAMSTVAGQRGEAPLRLVHTIRGELDWIVMKCLEKDRNRRYETVGTLAADVQRYLNDEPVMAYPPSVGYRFQKFIRRHTGPVAAGVVVLLVLVAGIVGTTIGLLQANDQAHKASEAQKEADDRRQHAETATELLASIFKNLNPERGSIEGPELKNRLVAELDNVAVRVEEATKNPLMQARLQVALGDAYLGVGEYRKAVVQLERSLKKRLAELGPDHFDTLVSMHNLAHACLEAGERNRALALIRETVERERATLPLDHPSRLTSLELLASTYEQCGNIEEALSLCEELVAASTRRLGADHPDTLRRMHFLANGYRLNHKPRQGQALLEQVVEMQKRKLGLDNTQILESMSTLAVFYVEAGHYDQAVSLLRQAWNGFETRFGPEHPHTLKVMSHLAEAYAQSNELNVAMLLYERVVMCYIRRLGYSHPETAIHRRWLSVLYTRVGKPERAVTLFEQLVEETKARLGPDDPSTLQLTHEVASWYERAGKHEVALRLHKEVYTKRKATLGLDHENTRESMLSLVRAYRADGKPDQALRLLEETAKEIRAQFPFDHPCTIDSAYSLAKAYRSAGKYHLAVVFYEQVVKGQKARLRPDDPSIVSWVNEMASVYVAAGKPKLAVAAYEEILATWKTKLTTKNNYLQTTMLGLADEYRKMGQVREALTLQEEVLTARKARFGPGHLTTVTSVTSVALLHLALGEIEKADTLFSEGLDAVSKHNPEGSQGKAYALLSLSQISLQQKKYAAAASLLCECLKIFEKTDSDKWITFNTMSVLGGVLLAQKKYPEAELLIIQGFDGMKKREATIPVGVKYRLTEAIERVVQLYEATDRPEKANEWRMKLKPGTPVP